MLFLRLRLKLPPVRFKISIRNRPERKRFGYIYIISTSAINFVRCKITYLHDFCNFFKYRSIFTPKSADIKLAYLQSAVSGAKVDRFEKFEIMIVCLDLMKEKIENACFL